MTGINPSSPERAALERTGLEVAVIGMAGRFPGAKTIAEFWENIKNGVETIVFYTPADWEKHRIGPETLEKPGYVNSPGGELAEREYFDASFFGFTPREATIMHPEARIFLECCWEALEHAGYNPDTYEGLIGLYAGGSSSVYWESLCVLSGESGELGLMAARLLNDKDHMCTRISHKLNLKGASFILNNACSTSLVAIHLACRALLAGDCDMVLAGGVSVLMEEKAGYFYEQGMILSPDGHCRAFDARAQGTVGGEGAGIVVLKLLEDARQDGDCIHALIKGSAINNDGSRKVGYTAPSVEGQADVIRTAHRLAGVKAESITYIEAHGTGTPLGDPIELASLKLAFHTAKTNFCGIGSVKTNIGHLDQAAGVAGLIKTIMALKYRLMPPSLHFETANPGLGIENSPFYINTAAVEWKSGEYPRRAGVSSFGIGGTNAHIILEEAPEEACEGSHWLAKKALGQDRSGIASPATPYRLIVLSAKTKTALDKMTYDLAEHFKKHPGLNLDDAVYTLQEGRKPFPYRRMTTVAHLAEASQNLSQPDSRKVTTSLAAEEQCQVIFMFPGLGGQYVEMGLELYRNEPVFRQETDRCFEFLKPMVDYDIKEIIYPGDRSDRSNSSYIPAIDHFEVAQPAIFIFEYALSRLLMHWGIKPQAMIGYSFGEYTAACLSGVFSLEEALKLIAQRGELIRQAPAGGMLSVPLPVESVRPLLDSGLVIAIDNGPSCVISGPAGSIAAFEKKMKARRHLCIRLKGDRALHSGMMAPLAQTYADRVSQVKLSFPRIPYISNVTGAWITAAEAVNPVYWANHLQGKVHFADGVKELLKKKQAIFLEVGPGNDLGALVRHHTGNESLRLITNTVRHPQDNISDYLYLLKRVGRLWLTGIPIDWQALAPGKARQRIPLPTYPFEGKPYWIEGNPFRMGAELMTSRSGKEKKADIADWFYYPSWKRSLLGCPGPRENLPGSCWLVLADNGGLGSQLARRLTQDGHEVILVKPGLAFARQSLHEYTVNPGNSKDYDLLLQQLEAMGKKPQQILHLWCLSGPAAASRLPDQVWDLEALEKTLALGFYSLIYLARALGKRYFSIPIKMTAITDHLHPVTGREALCPAKATILGAIKVIPQEYANIDCFGIDIELAEGDNGHEEQLVRRLIQEFLGERTGAIAALRGPHRWVPTYEPIRLEKNGDSPGPQAAILKEKGVYLVTGGLGGIGFELAKHLARQVRARLILTGRTHLPAREEWNSWQKHHEADEGLSRKIAKIRELENLGAEVMVYNADAANLQAMQQVVYLVRQQWGAINGVIHSAGVADGCTIHLRTKEATDQVLLAKVMGTIVLDRVLNDTTLDFFILCSSLASIFAMFGQAGYGAANAFQDAFAHWKSSGGTVFATAINWDTWKEVGMGVATVAKMAKDQHLDNVDLLLDKGILNGEGIDSFARILQYPLPQVVVSTTDLTAKLAEEKRGNLSSAAQEFELEAYTGTLQPRPELSMEYVAPRTEFEKTFADLLKQFFGYDRVGIDDNLFEFGVTSLSLIRINSLLREKLKKDIPIVLMFEYPTIGALGRSLELEEKGEAGSADEEWELQELEKEEQLLQQSLGLFSLEA
jgi:acyl transferase domain-containing protein/acyl carrier protein